MLRQLFRQLILQNLSTRYDFINISYMIILVPILATREVVVSLANDSIMLGRSILLFIIIYLEQLNQSNNSCFIAIFRIMQKLWIRSRRSKRSTVLLVNT